MEQNRDGNIVETKWFMILNLAHKINLGFSYADYD